MNDHQIHERRLQIAALLRDAVSSVRNEGGTFIDIRCTGEVVVGGSHIVIGDVDAVVFREDMGTVIRKKVLLDDVVSVETFWGLPPEDGSPRPVHLAPSLKEATILSVMIMQAVRDVPEEAIRKANIAHLVHIAREGDPMFEGPSTARHLRGALRLLPGLVSLRGDHSAHNSVSTGPTAFISAIKRIEAEGMIDRKMPVHTSAAATALDMLPEGRVEEIVASQPMIIGAEEDSLDLPADVVSVLDTADTLATVFQRFMKETEPFARIEMVRLQIEAEMERWFVPRG